MKKIASLLMAVLMLATMLTVFALPASAANNTTVMAETGTCHVELKSGVYTNIEFTPSVKGTYTFISENTSGAVHLVASLYYKTRKLASSQAESTESENFCVSNDLEAGKTYRLEIQLRNGAASCSADVSVMKVVIPEGICEISGKCIIRQPGTYECEYFIVKEGSSVIIDKSTTVNVKQGLANYGKIELLGKLDLSQAYAFQPGDISIVENGNLVKPQIKSSHYCDIITWHKNGGTLTRQGALISSLQGDTYETYYTPGVETELYYGAEKPGFGFGGWYNNPDFTGKPVTKIGANETGNKDFYARFCTRVAVPEAEEGLSYTGELLTGVPAGEGYTIKDNVKANVGTYNAVATLVDGYIWADGTLADKTIPWSIGKRKVTVSYLERTVNNDNTVSTEEKICDYAEVITPKDTEWGVSGDSTWYVVYESVDLDNRPVVKGDVHIILKNETTLTANHGITVEEGGSISFYAQSDNENIMGKLTAETGDVTAIGGGNGGDGKGGNSSITEITCTGGNGGNINGVYFYGGNILLKSTGVCIGGGNGGKGGYVGFGGICGKGGNGGSINAYFYGGKNLLKSTNASCIAGGKGGNGGSITSYNDKYNRPGDGGNGGKTVVYFYGGENSLVSPDAACIAGGNGGNSGTNCDGYYYINGGNGGGIDLYFCGGSTSLESTNKPCLAAGTGGVKNGSSGQLNLNISGTPVMKAGTSAESAELINNISEYTYTNQKYLSVQYNITSFIGSVLSNGNVWIIAAVAVIVIGGIAALVIVRKKKKPALASGENKDEE